MKPAFQLNPLQLFIGFYGWSNEKRIRWKMSEMLWISRKKLILNEKNFRFFSIQTNFSFQIDVIASQNHENIEFSLKLTTFLKIRSIQTKVKVHFYCAVDILPRRTHSPPLSLSFLSMFTFTIHERVFPFEFTHVVFHL